MAPKANQVAKMIAQAEAQIDKMAEGLVSGDLTPEAEAESLKTIEDMLAKIERLNSLTVRLEAVKKSK